MKFLRSIFGKTAVEPATPVAPAEAGPDPVMAALAELEVKRLREALAAATPASAAEPGADFLAARPNRVVKSKPPLPEGTAGHSVNIWDLDEAEADAVPAKAAAPVAEAERRRPTRTRTRILGFEPQPSSVVSLYEETEKQAVPVAPAAPGHGRVMFPAGWLVVKDGPGKGAAF
ncbi:MAG: hypothetical protein C0524_09390, partial [Rhodobacter sp.]|nr:hypothetical protein [Rhodobacter sp.]